MPTSTIRGTATYTAANDTFTWHPAASVTLHPPSGGAFYAIVLKLTGASSNSSQVTWAPTAIHWNNGIKPPTSSGITLPTANSTLTAFGVHDNLPPNSHPSKFHFRAHVVYNGQTRTSPDPEVVLDPPPG